MTVVGSAEVIVRAITSQVKRDIEKAFRDARAAVRAEGEAAGQEYGNGFKNGFNSSAMADHVGKVLGDSSVHDSAGQSGRSVGSAFGDGLRDAIDDIDLDVDVDSSHLVDSLDSTADEASSKFTRAMRSAGGNGGRSFLDGFLTSGFQEAAVAASDKFSMMLVSSNLLGTAISGLISSLSAAVSGLFAMGSAAAQAAGAIGVLPGVVSVAATAFGTLKLALSGVGKAIQAGVKASDEEGVANKALASSAYAVADAQKALGRARQQAADAAYDAAQRVADAEDNVKQAQLEVLDAQRQLNFARQDAIESLQQLAFSAEDAALGEQRAALRLQDAHKTLQAAQNLPPDNRARIEAELSYKEAELAYRQAKDRNNDLAKEQKKASKAGVKGSEEVVDARKRINDAQGKLRDAEESLADARLAQQRQERDSAQALADANERLRRAQEQYNQAQSDGSASSKAYEAALKKLSPEAQKFTEYLVSLKDETRKLKREVGKDLFPGLEAGIRPFIDNVFPMLGRELRATGGHLGDAADGFGHIFTKAKPLGRLKNMIRDNNDMLAIFTDKGKNGENTFSSLGRVILRVLRAVQPLTTRFAEWIDVLIKGADKATNTKNEMDKLRHFFKRAGDTAAVLGDIFGNLFGSLGALSKAARPAGNSLLDSFRKATKHLEKFLKTPEQQKTMRKFFRDASRNLKKIGDLVVIIGEEFFKLGDNKGIGDAADNLQPFIRNVGKIIDRFTNASPELSKFATSMSEVVLGFTQSDQIKTMIKVLTFFSDIVGDIINSKFGGWLLGIGGMIAAVTRSTSIVIKVMKFFGMAIAGGPIKAFKFLEKWKNFFTTLKTKGWKAALAGLKTGSDNAKEAFERQMKTDKAKIKVLKKLETQAEKTANALGRLKTTGEPAASAVKDAANDASSAASDAVNSVDDGSGAPQQAPGRHKKSIRERIKGRLGGRNEGGFVDFSKSTKKHMSIAEKTTDKSTSRMRSAFGKVGRAAGGAGKAAGKVGGAFKKMGGGLMALTGGPLGLVMLAIPLLIKAFQYLYKHSPAFRKFVDGIVEKLKQFGDWAKKIIEKYVLPALEQFFGWVNENLPKVQAWFGDMGDKLKKVGRAIKDAWNSVVQYFKDVKKSFDHDVQAIKNGWESLKKGTEKVFTAIKDFIKKHWKLILSILTGPIGALVIFIVSHWDDIKEKTGELVDKVKEKFEAFKDKVADLRDSLKEKIESIKDFFKSIPEAVSEGFSNMIGNAKNGINGLITFINDNLIKKINDSKLAKVIHLSIPDIPTMATGGRVTGLGGPTQDNQLRALSSGEFVLRTAAAQSIGYDRLDRANRTGRLDGGGDTFQVFPSKGMDEVELAHLIHRQVRFGRRAGS